MMSDIVDIPTNLKDKKICLVTDWLTNLGGGERVVQAISDLFPNAPIYTTVVDRSRIGSLADRDIRTSFLQKIPILHKKHQCLLPLLPRAIESLDVSGYDLVLSFSSFGAKSVKTNKDTQKHVCYIHTPVRYAWEPDFDPRINAMPFFLKPGVKRIMKGIKQWDYDTRHRPDLYIANSTTTQARVKQYYQLESQTLYPPVEVNDFFVHPKKDYYLAAGRLVSYKKFVLIAEAFSRMRAKKLVIIGDGPDFKKVKAIADGTPNITMLGRVDRSTLAKYLSESRALILPQKEDAGIMQLEAFASGTPVIAYKDGGILDVMVEGVNGVFFEEQSVEGLMGGVFDFDKRAFSSDAIRETAEKYDTRKFQKAYLHVLSSSVI